MCEMYWLVDKTYTTITTIRVRIIYLWSVWLQCCIVCAHHGVCVSCSMCVLGDLFWLVDPVSRSASPPQSITDTLGVPSPIDTAFTRCNCHGNIYIIKVQRAQSCCHHNNNLRLKKQNRTRLWTYLVLIDGKENILMNNNPVRNLLVWWWRSELTFLSWLQGDQFWRLDENMVMEPGYPKPLATEFPGLTGNINAALAVPATRTRPETVFFFKNGRLYRNLETF